jgi:ParB-like chromosome segregation protein Spo0J
MSIEIQSVHPVAELFPMLSDDELDELAADIKENGLIHPLIVTPDGQLVDGRNRLEACERLGIEARVEIFEGDPVAYILSTNIARRHLNKGQSAMLVVKAHPSLADSALREDGQKELAGQAGVSERLIRRAVFVYRWAPDLVDPVIARTTTLDDAERDAQNRKAASESADAKLGLLRSKAADLADEVTEERLTLTEAMGAYRARQEEDEKNRKVATRLLSDSIIPLAQLDGFSDETAARYDPELALPGREVTIERIERAQEVLRHLEALWRKAGR